MGSSSTTRSCRPRRARPPATLRGRARARPDHGRDRRGSRGRRARRATRGRRAHRRCRRDGGDEPRLLVHEPRPAFPELDAGAELYCLHKNRWWQTSAAAARCRGLRRRARVRGRHRGHGAREAEPAYFEAALEALDAEPERTWMVGDDIEADIAGAQRLGMQTVLVRTGKFRPDAVERSGVMPDAILSSDRRPAGLDRGARSVTVGVDLIEIERVRRALERYPASASGASPRPSAPTATRGRTRPSTTPGRFAAKEAVGKALGFGVARAFAWRDVEIVGRPKPACASPGGAAWARRTSSGRDRSLDDVLAGTGRRRLRRRPGAPMFEPLYTADEMRAPRSAYPGTTWTSSWSARARPSQTWCCATSGGPDDHGGLRRRLERRRRADRRRLLARGRPARE